MHLPFNVGLGDKNQYFCIFIGDKVTEDSRDRLQHPYDQDGWLDVTLFRTDSNRENFLASLSNSIHNI